MDLQIEKVGPETVACMQQGYLATLSGPMDCFWQEGLIAAAGHFQINVDGDPAGYFVANDQKQMMQFHVSGAFQRRAPEIFAGVLEAQGIGSALAATIEPMYFGLCLDLQKQSRVHTYLFSDHESKEPVLDSMDGQHFRPATMDDASRAALLMGGGDEFVDNETVEAHFGNFMGYARMVIEQGILHVLEKNGELLGIGEFRVRAAWPPYVDMGMIVNKKYRRMGLGSYILKLLKAMAEAQNLRPICSCEAGNEGSKKAVENAGFIARNRVALFTF